MTNRIEWIDAAKGFTMLLVIIGHCLDGYLKANLFPQHTHWMQIAFDFLYSFHMPLFFMLSGYLFYYAYNGYDLKKIVHKATDLILLYFGYSIIQCLVQIAMAAKINKQASLLDIVLLPLYTVPPYWYLYVLFFLYIISSFIKPLDKKYFILVFVVGIVGSLTSIRIFSISVIAYYLLFFTFWG